MIKSLITKTLNYAFDHQVGYIYNSNMDMTSRSLSFPPNNFMIINANWYNYNEIPFIIAHETSHVLNDHDSNLYNSVSPTYHIKSEFQANVGAVRILIPLYMDEIGNDYCSPTVDPIMDSLCIPPDMKDYVIEIVQKRLWFNQ